MENNQKMLVEEIKVFMAENLQGVTDKIQVNIEESKKKMRAINSAWDQIQKLKSN